MTDPMKSAAADAAANAAAYSARHTYALGWEAGKREATADRIGAEAARVLGSAESRIAIESARADAAERMVCELRVRAFSYLGTVDLGGVQERAALIAALSSTADVAERWVRVDPVAGQRLSDEISKLIAERDAAIAARDEAVARLTAERDDVATVAFQLGAAIARAEKAEAIADRAAWSAQNAHDLLSAAEKARDEVGIQLAAAQERLRLAMACVEAADKLATQALAVCGMSAIGIGPAILDMEGRYYLYAEVRDRLDTVPGDALARPIDTENPVSHLEALGIDTANVKGGE